MTTSESKAIKGWFSYQYVSEKVGKARLDPWIEHDKIISIPDARAGSDDKEMHDYWYEETYDVGAEGAISKSHFASDAHDAEVAASMMERVACSSHASQCSALVATDPEVKKEEDEKGLSSRRQGIVHDRDRYVDKTPALL